ncbi:hypothetical protein Q5P01_019995 [Channa striata]|uniref:Uncharacterized protein n=1 Tax=Channa striata TaxID=64152 RepID=A0AA88LWP2_CHASR|nr:hypothetical protein Q5P01_019995 [Channa striata]
MFGMSPVRGRDEALSAAVAGGHTNATVSANKASGAGAAMAPGGEQQPRPLSGYELEELRRLLPPSRNGARGRTAPLVDGSVRIFENLPRRRLRPTRAEGYPAGDVTYPRWWLALAFGGQGGRTESSSGPSVSPPPTDQGGSSVRAANAPSPWPPARPSMENRGSTERPAEEASVEGLARVAQGDFAFKTKVRGAHEGQLVNKFPKPAKKHGTPYEILEQHKKRNKTKQDRVLDVPL